jgi:hypothetical protein
MGYLVSASRSVVALLRTYAFVLSSFQAHFVFTSAKPKISGLENREYGRRDPSR